MFDEKTSFAIFGILLVLFFVLAIMVWRGNTLAISAFEKKISEESLSAGMYYSAQALPCLSKNPNALDETKRFVLDKEQLDSEILGFGQLSCAAYGEVKYLIGIYDLDNKTLQWTFRNYQPLEEDKFIPRYGQVVLVDDSGKLDRAFIGVSIESPPAKGKLPLYAFCNSTVAYPAEGFTSVSEVAPSGDGGLGTEDAYSYNTNGCDSGNCIKGPGQALPTCQPVWCTYSGNTGDACKLDCQCASFSCGKSTGKCVAGTPMTALIAGQPCKTGSDCASDLVCAYDKRCRAKVAGRADQKTGSIDISQFNFH